MSKDSIPGTIIKNKYKSERNFTAGVSVWNDQGKLYVRVPVEGDHPL